RIGLDVAIARLEGGEGHVAEELRALIAQGFDEVPSDLELMHDDGAARLAPHESVDLPPAEGGGGRARAAHRDDRYVTVGLEARVPQHGAEGKVGGAARAGHAALGPLESL